ncbi:igE-binding protein-like [Psammomys obesus]|uniref:igE-binding protein-like n=1 Tax=Psammomys obesus TaxID=48139 RepID=UPI002452ADF9|nr:igE-binding protein-like [Psammomys obesus]
MGASHSVITALQSLLKQHELKLSKRTLEGFITEIDRIAPWFVCSGSLTLASWDKLEGDLQREEKDGKLKVGTSSLWILVKSCLEDRKCRSSVAAGQGVLEEIQDSMSETERDRRLRALKEKEKDVFKKKGPSVDGKSTDRIDKGKDALGEKGERGRKNPKKKPLYPIKELEALGLDNSESEELSPSEEEDLEKEAARYEEERYHPDKQSPPPGRVHKGGSINRVHGAFSSAPSAPPPYVERHGSAPLVGISDSFFSKEDKRKLFQAFPVFEAADGGRTYAPVEYPLVKELAESVNKYGVDANFTIMQLERLAGVAMTPSDWQNTVNAALPNMGQYLEWKALWHDASQTQAGVNSRAEGAQRQWTFDLLTGQGQFVHNQTNYDPGAYGQISAAAIKAWKALSKKGEAGGHLTKIIQGPQEPFSEFVARMTEAAGRIFGDPERVRPMIEQLVYENASPECKTVITPRRNKGLTDWIKICRGLGGPLTNAGLAAALLQSKSRSGPGSNKTCYSCGKPGHLKRDCRATAQKKVPGLCPKCRKGNHWANECRSVRDIQGKLIQHKAPPNERNENIPKNEFQGPRSQGPKKYGTQTVSRRVYPAVEQQEDQQDWTSVPPPSSY